MLSQSLKKEEKQENIIGFHVLSDGSFLKVYNNRQVEIQRGGSTSFIKIKDVQSDLNRAKTKIVELPDQRIALAYCMGWGAPSFLVVLDLKEAKCIASRAMQEIQFLSALEDGSFLINSDTICSFQNNELVITTADQFNDFTMRFFDARYTVSDTGCRYLSLPDKSGYVYFDAYHQSNVKMLNNQHEVKGELQLGPKDYDPFHIHYRDRRAFESRSHRSQIKKIIPTSKSDFACITQCNDKFFGKYTYRLHIFNANSACSDKTTLHHIEPKQLFALNNEHVAVVGEQKGKNDHKIFVNIFNSKCQKIKEVTFDKDIRANYIAVTPNEQLVTCSKTGEIVIHHIFTLTEKLKKETESVLVGSKLPKELVSIVTDYAGFFSGSSGMPKDKFAETDYPDEPPSLFSKLRAKF